MGPDPALLYPEEDEIPRRVVAVDGIPDPTRATYRQGIGGPSPAGLHPAGAAPCGALDLAGNVWEWTATEYPPGERVLRGGSFASPGPAWATCTFRSHSRPERRQSHIGFRVARGAA